ncbi:MAG: hypothetical protein HKM04_03805 [Legionellales bacterium]|nr:hypothetical protein [Legionellales bacterium]
MRFIDHMIEPTKLLLVWQPSDERYRTRYTVAEINRVGDDSTLTYLVNTPDFIEANKLREFNFLDSLFGERTNTRENALDTFMSRLPPRTRGDFSEYLENFRIKPDATFSDFALLAYTGAKLPTDGFSVINPFEDVEKEYEFLLEITGFRYNQQNNPIEIGAEASFLPSFYEERAEDAITIIINEQKAGYVTRALIPTVQQLIKQNRIKSAYVEKMNGSRDRPAAYLYVSVAAMK